MSTTAASERHRLAGERRVYMGANTPTLQARLAQLRRMRSQLEAEAAAHPSRSTSIALAAVYSELAAATLRAIPFDADEQADEPQPMCWCDEPAVYWNEATDATPAHACCADHMKDGYRPLGS